MLRLATSTRIAVLAVLLAFGSNLAIVGFIYLRTHDQGEERLKARVLEESEGLASVYKLAGPAALQRAIREMLDDGDAQIALGLFDARGRPVLGNIVGVEPDEIGRAGYRIGPIRETRMALPIESAYIVRPIKGGYLLTGRTLGEVFELRRTVERSLLLAIGILLLLGPIYGVIIARYVGSRVDAIRRVVDAAAGGDLARRVPETPGGRGDAFDALAARINNMFDRIGTLMDELRLLTDSLAHDLRSPVARLRTRIERAMTEADEAQRDQLLSGVIVEADALMRMLTTAIEIGKTEGGVGRDQFEWIDPAELIAELAEMYEPMIEEAGLDLGLEIDSPLASLWGHRQLLAQALSNLVDNALRHGSAGGTLLLFGLEREGMLRIGVADRGPGIAPEDQAHARRRFGRLDASRSVSGAGLGLSLVAAVAHLHGGTFELVDNLPGLRAALVLPRHKVAQPG